LTVVKGSPIDNLGKFLKPLFMSSHEKELIASNKRRRVQYLKRKYGKKEEIE
jgi:hypothetical protein